MDDLVSVIIPTYKRPKKLGRAISSVLEQSYHPIEIIVVDDNNDGDEYRKETINLMHQYEGNNQIKYIQHSSNQNGAAARNTGIHNSSGKYIAFLDDDDYYLPDKIRNDIEILHCLPNDYGGICSNYIKIYKRWIYKVSSNHGSFDSCYEMLSGKADFAAGSTLLIKKSCLDYSGLFDTSFQRHQDWDFLIRFFRNYKLYITDMVNVVLSADGIRNNPNTDRLIAVKKHLVNVYSKDIKELSIEQQHDIAISQSKEILNNYLKERKYLAALIFCKSNEYIRFSVADFPRNILSFVLGIFPQFILLIYMLLGLRHMKYTNVLKE